MFISSPKEENLPEKSEKSKKFLKTEKSTQQEKIPYFTHIKKEAPFRLV